MEDTFSASEIFAALERLFQTPTWEQKFQLLQQEQTILSSLQTDNVLSMHIQQKKQESSYPQQEIDFFIMHLHLLRRIREVGLQVAWEELMETMIPENTKMPAWTALNRLFNSRTLDEIKVVVAQERLILLSGPTEVLLQYMIVQLLQSSEPSREEGMRYMRVLASFLKNLQIGNERLAWREMEIFVSQMTKKTERITVILEELAEAENSREMYAILEREQDLLFTQNAENILDFIIQQVEHAPDADDEMRLMLLNIRQVLLQVREIGIEQARKDGIVLEGIRQTEEAEKLKFLLVTWLRMTSARAKCRYLEEHLKIIQPRSEVLLQEMIQDILDEHPEISLSRSAAMLQQMMQHLVEIDEHPKRLPSKLLLRDAIQEIEEDEKNLLILQINLYVIGKIRQRGSTIQAVREVHVDVNSGFVLDMPLWLAETVQQLTQLKRSDAGQEKYLQLLQEIILHANNDRDVVPEVLAELQNLLGNALASTVGANKSSALAQQEAVIAYSKELQVFSFERYPLQYAKTSYHLGTLYAKRLEGNKRENMQIAIASFQEALRGFTREDFPMQWAGIQRKLSDVYLEDITGDRQDNLEHALSHIQAALQYCQRDTLSVDWAEAQIDLGSILLSRVEGGPRNNQEQAITCFLEAQHILIRETFPEEWARAQRHLGNIYYQRIEGGKRENQEKALSYCLSALEIFTQDTSSMQWAATQLIFANIYRERLAGERRANIERSIDCCRLASQVYTRDISLSGWATTQLLYGLAYSELGTVSGKGGEPYERALECYLQIEEVLAEESYPFLRAATQLGLSFVYLMRREGDNAARLQKAITCGLAALDAFTQTYPYERAGTYAVLAEAYHSATGYPELLALYGGRISMQAQALNYMESALAILTTQTRSLDWAIGQQRLAAIYTDRIEGDRVENMQRAQESIILSLGVFRREFSPFDWAEAQALLGDVFLRTLGKMHESVEEAITCYQASLDIFTLIAYPIQWAARQSNLCHAYWQRVKGDRQQNFEQAIQYGKAALQIYTYQDNPYEWAATLFYLGAIYLSRVSGEYRENIEIAIDYLNQSLQIFDREYKEMPSIWAGIQLFISMAYYMRSEGSNDINSELARFHIEKARNVKIEEYDPQERGMLWSLLGMLASQGGNLQEAEDHYKMALSVITNDAMFQKAMIELQLGLVYCQRAEDGDKIAYLTQAQTYLLAALRAFTREIAPVYWAFTTALLGIKSYTAAIAQTVSQEDDLDSAATYLQQALDVFTLDTFPDAYRRFQSCLLLVELRRQNWEEVYQAAQDVYAAEQRLLLDSTGVTGFDAILKVSTSSSPLGAFALIRQGKIEQAAITLEQGCARSIAQAMVLYEAAPERIRDLELRTRYIKVRQTLQRARADLAQMTALKNPDEQGHRQIFLKRATVCRDAQEAFDAVIDEIRLKRDPAGFLDVTVNLKTLQQATTIGGSGHALVYLAAPAEVDGFALAVFSPNSLPSNEEQAALCFAVCELPGLKSNLISYLVTRGREGNASSIGGLFRAQTLDIHQIYQDLAQFKSDGTLRNIVEKIQTTRREDTWRAAQLRFLQDPLLVALLDKPYETLGESELVIVSSRWAYHFLHLELQYCQEQLLPILLYPLQQWLQQLPISTVTLIPCGLLADLPLTTLILDDGETLADKLPMSVAPSARSLLHEVSVERTRTGIYTLGNPDPPRNLPWSEAESLSLAQLAHYYQMERHVFVQEQVTRKNLLHALRCAKVLDLSCHGMVQIDNFLQSSLYLAMNQRLTLADILGWEQDIQGIRLLILSACQTAIPDVSGAVDEVRSLTSALLQAGVRAVLAPLWLVDDRATYLLMTRFAQEWFPRIQFEGPATALARAQRWLRTVTNRELQQWEITTDIQLPEVSLSSCLTTRRYGIDADQAQELIRQTAKENSLEACPYADPAYWAGFQVVGW